MAMQTRQTSDQIVGNRVSAAGFQRALKRVGKSELAKAFKSQPLSLEAGTALKEALGILSTKAPVTRATKGVCDFKVSIQPADKEVVGEISTTKTVKQPKAKVAKVAEPSAKKAKAKPKAKAAKPPKYRKKVKANAEPAIPSFVGPPAPQDQPIVVGPRPASTLVAKHKQGLIKVELQKFKMSKRVPTFTDAGKFVAKKSFEMTVLREPAYIEWLKDHPNIKTVQLESSDGSCEYREVVQREWVNLGSDVQLSLGYGLRKILVPTDYSSSELECRRKTYESKLTRGEKVELPPAISKAEDAVYDSELPWGDTSANTVTEEPFMDEVMMQRRLRNYRLQLIHNERHALSDDRGGFMRDVEMQKLGRLRYQLRREKVLATLPIVPFAQKVDPEELACAIGLARPIGNIHVTIENIDDPPQHPAVHTPEGASVLTEISRLEAMDAINDDSKIHTDPVFYHMWCADQAQQQHEEQERIELEEIALQQGLSKLEAALPSWFGNGGEVERLDRWYKSRCWCDPALEIARYESWFVERLDDVTLSLLDLESRELELKAVPSEHSVASKWESLGEYGSPMSDREAETERIYQRHRERFAERAKQNRSSSEGPVGVTGNAGIVLPSTSILTDPCAKERNITEGIMSQLDENVKQFKALTTVVSRATLGKLLESFTPNEDHYGLYLPQLE